MHHAQSQVHGADMREALPMQFACERFQQYGKTEQIQTDHKPLVTLFQKALNCSA